MAPFLLALGVLVTLTAGCSRYRRYQNQKEREAAREKPARLYAPQPAKDRGAYLVGVDGIDADGAPLRRVDRVQLRGMLARKEYGKLTQIFEELQSTFEAKPEDEAWPMDAAEAFESGETTIDADLDAWASSSRSAPRASHRRPHR